MTKANSLKHLKKRSEFLSVNAHKKRFVSPAFILLAGPRPDKGEEGLFMGLGLTSSKKMVGNAVFRNRARRRLRAMADQYLPFHGVEGYNYVLIARRNVLTRPFDKMSADLEKALKYLNLWRDS